MVINRYSFFSIILFITIEACFFCPLNSLSATGPDLDQTDEIEDKKSNNSATGHNSELTSLHKQPEQKNKSTEQANTELIDRNNALQQGSGAKIIVLNKITAKSSLEYFKIGEARFFGNLSIEVNKCLKNTDPFEKNNLMLVNISDNKTGGSNILIFHGWLISSNPSISTPEHPVYEIIPAECE